MAEVIIDLIGRDDNARGIFSEFGNIMTGLKSTLDLVSGAFRAVENAVMPFIDSASESQLALANLDATLRSTGGAAGVTRNQVIDLANAFQEETRFSDEAIMNAEAMLLTFTSIGKDIFPLATQSVLDLAAKMGGDLNGAAIQVGKALNDPINGVTALRRVGVQLTDTQEEMIKKFVEQGDLMSAQTIIVNELQTEFGGLAVAMGDTFAGKLDQLKNKFDNLRELIGGPIIIGLSALMDKIFEFGDTDPIFNHIVDSLTLFNDLLNNGMPLWYSLAITFADLRDLSPVFADLSGAFLTLQNALDKGTPFIDALVLGLDNLKVAWAGTPFESIVTEVEKLINIGTTSGWGAAFQTLFTDIWTALDLKTKVNDFLTNLSDTIAEADWTSTGTMIGNLLSNALKFAISTTLATIDALVSAVPPETWGRLGSVLLDALKNMLVGMWNSLSSDADLQDSVNKAVASPFLNPTALNVLFSTYFSMVISDIEKNIGNWFSGIGTNAINGLINGWNSFYLSNPFLQKINDWINGLMRFLGISSPSTVFFDIGKNIVQGLINGITSMFGLLPAVLGDLVAGLLSPLAPVLDLLGMDTSSVIPGEVGGRDMGGGTTGGGYGGGSVLTGGSVTNIYNFYGQTFLSGVGPEGTYDCKPTISGATGGTYHPAF